MIPIWVIGALSHHKTHTLRLREAAVVGSCGALTVPIGAEIASHVGALPLRVIFAAFLIATVGRSLLHTQPRKPAAAAGSRSGTGSRPGAGTHVQTVLHRPLRPEQRDGMRPFRPPLRLRTVGQPGLERTDFRSPEGSRPTAKR